MPKLHFITHHTEKYSYVDSARMALEGGCRWIQLRMKDAPAEEWMRIGKQIGLMCRQYDAKFILNDHVEYVKPLQADGVHLGKNDMPVDEARNILGAGFIIGGTANTLDDIILHAKRGADYIGCGPFRFTTTKEKLAPILGLEGYRTLIKEMKTAGVHLPVVAIGGITRADIPNLMSTGIDGIALSGTILNANNPVQEMQRIIEILGINE
ncbi:MAG: thiamine phosphate synthase [Paraprevotella sp.]|nr:thiamine phosphate synthase [Paraprevotella sp.]